LINNGYGYEGSGNDIAKSMAVTTNWNSYSTPGIPGYDPASNNSSGFSALPGGFRGSSGNFGHIGYLGFWWSSMENSTGSAFYRYMNFGSTYVYGYDHGKDYGFSVCCVRDF